MPFWSLPLLAVVAMMTASLEYRAAVEGEPLSSLVTIAAAVLLIVERPKQRRSR